MISTPCGLTESQLEKVCKQENYFPPNARTQDIPAILAILRRRGRTKEWCNRLLRMWLDDRGNGWKTYMELLDGIVLAIQCGYIDVNTLKPAVREQLVTTPYWKYRERVVLKSHDITATEIQLLIEIIQGALLGEIECVDYLLKKES